MDPRGPLLALPPAILEQMVYYVAAPAEFSLPVLHSLLPIRGACTTFKRLSDLIAVNMGSDVYEDKFTDVLPRYAFGPVLLWHELSRSHGELVEPLNGSSFTAYHPALHDRLYHAPRLIYATLFSPEWLRFMLVRHVRSRGSVEIHKNVWTVVHGQAQAASSIAMIGALVLRFTAFFEVLPY